MTTSAPAAGARRRRREGSPSWKTDECGSTNADCRGGVSLTGQGCDGGVAGGMAGFFEPLAAGAGGVTGRGSGRTPVGPKMSLDTPGGRPSTFGFLDLPRWGNGTEANGSVGDSIGPAFRTPQSPPAPQPLLRKQ